MGVAPHKGTDLRYTAPGAGDWGPGEGGFLARSAKGTAAYPNAVDVNGDWREFVRMRETHTRSPSAPDGGRHWLGAADESFASEQQHRLERPEEYEGRMALHCRPKL